MSPQGKASGLLKNTFRGRYAKVAVPSFIATEIEVTVMDFVYPLDDETRAKLFVNIAKDLEEQIWKRSWSLGLRPDELDAETWVPPEQPSPSHLRLRDELDMLLEARVQLAMLGG